MVCWLLLVVKVVTGLGSGRFANGTLGSAIASCAGVTYFWMLVIEVIRGASTSVGDRVAFAESVGGIKVSSGG